MKFSYRDRIRWQGRRANSLLIIAILGIFGCDNQKAETSGEEVLTKRLPNIILIMADDMGYESLSCNGSIEYQTPRLDALAAEGIRFTHCIAQPLCTPSRVKIMTGMHNYNNYEYFGYLNPNQSTFANLLKDKGYATLIAGKWQLNGLSYDLEGKEDPKRPHHFGFDEYCLWQLTHPRKEGERYANPLIEQNGQIVSVTGQDYGPDIFADYILDFIERKKDSTFLVYYPMVLVHDPFVPTPDSKTWGIDSLQYKNDTTNFKDMVEYTDKIVGRIQDKLKELNIADNTLLIFTGDNGNGRQIITDTKKGKIHGFKGNTTDAGTNVPLIASWPGQVKAGTVFDGLVSFTDFYATLADIAGADDPREGHSLLPLLQNKPFEGRKYLAVHYDPRWGEGVNIYRNQFVRTVDYKLYQDGKFYHVTADPLESLPLEENSLSAEQRAVRDFLQGEINKLPAWKN